MRITVALVGLMGLTIMGILLAAVFSMVTVDEAKSLALYLLTPISGIVGFAVAFTLARQSQ
jgi:hypothetical protein